MRFNDRGMALLGIPDLPARAFIRKADGGIVPQGGDGGGSQPANSTQTTTTELPEWARPYAKDILAKGQALTDINQNPYQTYDQPRIAQFSPMQQQAMQGAAGMTTAPQMDYATGLAGAAGLGALGTTYQPGQFYGGTFGNRQAAQYMNPYMQNVVDIQQREAQRQADIAGTQQQAQATQSGAFGGSRDAIMRAERERNLAQQKGDIQAQGLNQAYQQAQAQFNADMARRLQAQQLGEQSRQYGAGLGMQGLQTGLQAAGQLGTLGAQQFQQGVDINKLQSAYGGMQQQQAQQGLDVAYQNFLNQQNYPYKQLGFMSDLLRGTPTGSSSTVSMYGSQPSTLQNLAALGTGAYGLSKFMADGGKVEGYALGGQIPGGSVRQEDNMATMLDEMSDEQLARAEQAAMARRDAKALELIKAEKLDRATKEGTKGIASAFTSQMADRMLPTEAGMAHGGIVAFAGDEEDNDQLTGQLVSQGNPAVYNQVTGAFPAMLNYAARAKYTPMSDEAYNEAIRNRRAMLEEGAGPSPYADIRNQIAEMQSDREKNLEQQKGMAALAAIPAILQGNNAMRGIAGGLGAYGQAYGQALQADKAEKRSLMNMQINLADSERKERMGLNREAIGAADQARKDHADAQMFGIKKAQALASIAGNMARATKPTGRVGAGAGEKPPKGFDALALAEYKGLVAAGEKPGDETMRLAYRNAANIWGKQPGEERTDVQLGAIGSKENLKVLDAVNKARFSPEYVEAKTPEARQEVLDRAEMNARKLLRSQQGGGAGRGRQGGAPAVNSNRSAPPAGFNLDQPN